MTTLGERIRIARGKEARESFSRLIGVGHATLKRYEYDQYKPDEQFLAKLAHTQGVNLNWLTTGQGPMYAESEPQKPDIAHADLLAALHAQIEAQRGHITALDQNADLAQLAINAMQRENEALREQLETQRRQIELLERALADERHKKQETAVNRIQAAG